MKHFKSKDWKNEIPRPIYDEKPYFNEMYEIAWNLAYQHIREIEGMPQTPYMDEAFCDTQIWIWDTCFMSLFCKYAPNVFPGVESLNNFYEPLYGKKELAEIIPTEAEPKWTGATPGVPYRINVHMADNPPLFAWVEYENALFSADIAHIKELLYEKQYLQKHFDWLESLKERTKIPGVRITTHFKKNDLGYQWEGACSGMDNTPRGRVGEDQTKERPNNPDMLWLDAICQQALAAKCISKLFSLVGDSENEKLWNDRYIAKKECVNQNYWDEQDRFYYDIDCNDLHFYRVPTIATFWTLTADIATKERASVLERAIADETRFGGRIPLVSLTRKDKDFRDAGCYWRGSVWLPSVYATLKGLSNYGFHRQTREIGTRVIEHMYQTYREYSPHTIWECYSPTAPSPGTQTDDRTIVRPDFCGWSALGPISVYIEFVLGFYEINAFEKIVKWNKPDDVKGKIGIENFRFGEVITDIVAEGNQVRITSNLPYCIEINQKAYQVQAGENLFNLI